MIKWIYIGFYAIKSNLHFQKFVLFIWVSNENFEVSVDNVSGMGSPVGGGLRYHSDDAAFFLHSKETEHFNIFPNLEF